MMRATLDGNPTPDSISAAMVAVADRLRCSTVQVRGTRAGAGSGAIWSADGIIITNAHVARSEVATVELNDGRTFHAERISRDPVRDLAALKIAARDLPAATIGDSESLRAGELVFAMGNSLGNVGALSTGVIHAVDSATLAKERKKEGEFPLPQLEQWVIADIRLAPGNSGGALANARGQVIGINTMIASGLALAIPSHTVERFLDGSFAPIYLGITIQPVPLGIGKRHVLGLLVLEVANNSMASEAGLNIGDILIGACGQYFRTPDDLFSILQNLQTGEFLPLEFLRSGKLRQATVSISRPQSETPQAVTTSPTRMERS